MPSLTDAFRGNRLFARVLRSSSWLVLGYGGSQFLRLASNLILARLLFPEAFGIMALVSVVTVGLMMFSDVGIGPAIAQSKRGDDQRFLDTAWTIQVIRGFLLWAGACLLAWPMAQFYAAPELMLYLPIAGLALVIAGFNPTRIETAHRHLLVGRVTALDLASQVIGIVSMIVLAWITRSVLALVIGGLITAAAKLVLMHFFLPGPRNRLIWEREAGGELLGFGKWIFLSTAFWFVSSQGDKAILGRFLSLDMLGIYNIGYFLASFPLLLGHAVNQRLMIPVYREQPPAAHPQNRRRLHRLRLAMSAGVLLLLAIMALAGPWLVDLLYDDRYAQAGAIIVVLACGMIPQVIGMTYDQAALAAGDSRRFFVFSGSRAVIQVVFLLVGIMHFGLLGALVGLGLAAVLVYPVLIWLASHHRAWDLPHDIATGIVGAGIIALALHWHWEKVIALAAVG